MNAAHLYVANVPVSETNPIFTAPQAKDAVHYDSFGRLRTSDPITLFDAEFVAGANEGRWSSVTANNGTVTHPGAGSAWMELALTVDANSSAIMQTRRYVNYQPGKSTQVIISMVPIDSALASTETARWGYFDAADGAFFESDASGLRVALRNTAVGADATVAQASWSVDPLDGSGPSGYTLDLTKRNIFFIEFKWLGSGDVTLGVVTGNTLWPAHTFSNVGAAAVPYWNQPSLPIRFELDGGATPAVHKMYPICCAVVSEGGFNPRGIIRSHARTAQFTVDDTETMVLMLRIQSAAVRTTVNILSASTVLITGAGNLLFRYYRVYDEAAGAEGVARVNPNAGWVAVNNSAVEYYQPSQTNGELASGLAAALSGGGGGDFEHVFSSFGAENAVTVDDAVQINLTGNQAGLSDIFVITAQNVVSPFNNESGYVAVTWQELS